MTFKMDPAIFMSKFFETNVSTFTIVKKNSILNVAGFKNGSDLTYSDNESSNTEFYSILIFDL